MISGCIVDRRNVYMLLMLLMLLLILTLLSAIHFSMRCSKRFPRNTSEEYYISELPLAMIMVVSFRGKIILSRNSITKRSGAENNVDETNLSGKKGASN